jgi:structural maintenance of chromosome 4
LDNIVTVNYEAASRVVDFLKRAKIGRATCIILEQITQFKTFMNNHFETPQHCVRLFDMVKCDDEQAKVAFYYALSNTLYCENMDMAQKVSMGD